MLRWRVLTAAVLAPLFLGAIWLLPSAGVALLFALIVALGAIEWTGLMRLARGARAAYVAGLLVLLAAAWMYLRAAPLLPLLALAALWWLVAMALLARFGRGHGSAPATPAAAVIGYLLLVPAWLGLVYLHGSADGPFWITFLLLLVWGADIGAYFAGRAFGRRKLAVTISPNKTWEGALGGVALALLAGVLFYQVMQPAGPSLLALIPLALVTIVISVIGDLFESMIKRQYGAKDSGNLLPGHGGVLDRIDSLTAAGPIFALGILLWHLNT